MTRSPSYPASIDSPAVLTVAPPPQPARSAPDSAYGAGSVDIAAPGDGVLTGDLERRLHARSSGTSFAAAYVSGAAALLAAARPSASGAQLRNALVRVRPHAAAAWTAGSRAAGST